MKFVKSLLLLALFMNFLNAQTYPIQFSRPGKVGDRARLRVKAIEERKNTLLISTDSAKYDDSTTNFEIEAEAEVLEVINNLETKLKFTVKNYSGTIKQVAIDFIPINVPLIAVNINHKTIFSNSDGIPLDEKTQVILRMAFGVSSEVGNDDKAFGATVPKMIGDSWPINKTFAIEGIKERGISINPEDISGTVKFVEKTKHNNIDCIRLSIDMDMRNLQNMPFPKFLTPTKCVFNVNISSTLPIDINHQIQQSILTITAEIIAYGKHTNNGVEQEIALTSRFKQQKTVELLAFNQ